MYHHNRQGLNRKVFILASSRTGFGTKAFRQLLRPVVEQLFGETADVG